MGFLNWFFGKFHEAQEQKQCSVLCTRGLDGNQIQEVRRGSQELYEEKGWKLKRGALHGYFRTKQRAFKGKVENPFSKLEFFIWNPPYEVLEGKHGACFQENGREKYCIHFSPVPEDVNAGILKVEHCLRECLHEK